jgi:hypothetical protein
MCRDEMGKRRVKGVLFFCCPGNRWPIAGFPEREEGATAKIDEPKGCGFMDSVCFRGRFM